MSLTTTETEALQTTVHDYLRTVGRSGNRTQMAERIALEHSLGARLVGFRRRGWEVLLHDETVDPAEIVIYEIDVDGTLLQVGIAGKGLEVEQWVRENRFYLDWIAPEWR